MNERRLRNSSSRLGALSRGRTQIGQVFLLLTTLAMSSIGASGLAVATADDLQPLPAPASTPPPASSADTNLPATPAPPANPPAPATPSPGPTSPPSAATPTAAPTPSPTPPPTSATPANPPVLVDLSKEQVEGGQIPAGSLTFEVRNTVPNVTYEIRYRINHDGWAAISPLTKADLSAPPATPQADDVCGRLQETLAKVLSPATDEKAIGSISREVELYAALCQGTSAAKAALLAPAVATFRAGVVKKFPENSPLTVADGDEVELSISRTIDGMTRKWTGKFTVPGPSDQWASTFGFIFMPNDDDLYFSKATSQAGKFQVTKKEDRGGYKFSPSYLYTWSPREWRKPRPGYWFWGLGAGFAWDGDDPSVLLSILGGIARNVALTGGIAIRKVARLSGEFDDDALPEISTQLTEAQLREDVYEPTVFLGLSMRFSANPFPQVAKPAAPTTANTSATGSVNSSGGNH